MYDNFRKKLLNFWRVDRFFCFCFYYCLSIQFVFIVKQCVLFILLNFIFYFIGFFFLDVNVSKGGKMFVGVIVGIVFGFLVFVFVIVVGVICFRRYYRMKI